MREFGGFTKDLNALDEWFAERGIEQVTLDTACVVAQRFECLGVAIARKPVRENELSVALGALKLFEEAAAEIS